MALYADSLAFQNIGFKSWLSLEFSPGARRRYGLLTNI